MITSVRVSVIVLDWLLFQIRHAPFLHAVESGTASPAQIAAIAAEEYSIAHSDLISFRQMADRWDSGTSHFFGDLDEGEAESLPLLLDFAANVGLSEQDLAAYEPRPRSQTYPSRVAWIASHADRASAAASLLVNFELFGETMGRIRDALISVYGFAPSQIELFTFFAGSVPGFEDAVIEVMATGLVEGACPVLVRRSAAAPGIRARLLAGGLRPAGLTAARGISASTLG